MKKSKLITFLLVFILFVTLYINYLKINGIWVIFLFILTIFLLLVTLVNFIEDKYPESKLGKKIVSVLIKIKDIVKELFP